MVDSSFLDQLHAQFSTPPARIVNLVSRHTGHQVEHLERVVNGYDNEVYRVALGDGGAVFVRIRRHGEGDFGGEIGAMALAGQAGIPVCEVVAADRVLTDDGERHVMIVRAAPGRAFETVRGELSIRQRHDALGRLGRLLARLHSVGMPGMWRPDASGQWPSQLQQRAYFVRDRLHERDELVGAGLSRSEIDVTYRVLQQPSGPPATEPVLCHGDLNQGHVFLDADLRVTSLIDWGMWHAGSAIGELAYVWKTFGDDGLEAVVGGYRAGSMADAEFRRSLATSLVEQQIGHIAHHVRIGDARGVERNVGFLRRALAELA